MLHTSLTTSSRDLAQYHTADAKGYNVLPETANSRCKSVSNLASQHRLLYRIQQVQSEAFYDHPVLPVSHT